VNNPIGQRHLRLRSLLKSEIRADGTEGGFGKNENVGVNKREDKGVFRVKK
jgi:hypothetical protein